MKILYLYYDLMNLYGDNGNAKALLRHLEYQGFDVTLEKKTVGDVIDFSEYEMIYCGSGTERNQKVALAHLMQYRDGLKKAVEEGKVVLFTGNSLEMLGKTIEAADKTVYDALNLMDFITIENGRDRHTGDAILSTNKFEGDVVGFINKCSEIIGVPDDNALFTVKMGKGNDKDNKAEGVYLNNCFGTYLTGPILVKNPHVLEFLITLVGKRCSEDFSYVEKNCSYEKKSYEVTLNALYNRLES